MGVYPGGGVLARLLLENRGGVGLCWGDLNPKFLGLPHECPMSQISIGAKSYIIS